MDRRTTAWIATAAASAALVAGTGAVLALQSDPKAPTVQLDTVDTSLETTTVTDAPTTTETVTTTADVTVTTSAPVAPSTTQYVAPSTTLYIPPVIPESGVCLTCSAPTTVIPVPTLPPRANP